MVNLLNISKKPDKNRVNEKNAGENALKNGNAPKKGSADNEALPKTKPEKININKYVDPEGLSLQKMKIGLWFIKNKAFFKSAFLGILALIGLITWPAFFYTFGKYAVYDIRQDKKMLNELASFQPISHELVLKLMPKNMIIGIPRVISNIDGQYDFVVEITNPNQKHWANFEYHYEYGRKKTAPKMNFILPEQTKFLIDSGIRSETKISQAEIVVTANNWKRLDTKKIPDYGEFYADRINFEFEDVELTAGSASSLTEKMLLNNLDFTLLNESVFNYWHLPINIILRSNSGIIGARQYTIEKVDSGELRTVSLTWPGRLTSAKDIDIEADINIFDPGIYMDYSGGLQEATYE